MQIVLPQANIINDREPVLTAGIPVLWARVQYLGGEIRVPNPEKFTGAQSDVRLDVSLRTTANTFRNKESGYVSGSVAHQVKFERIASIAVKK